MTQTLKCLLLSGVFILVPAAQAGPPKIPAPAPVAQGTPKNCFAGGYQKAHGHLPANMLDKNGHMGVGQLRNSLGKPAFVVQPGSPANIPLTGRYTAIIGDSHCVYIENGKVVDYQIGRGYINHPSLDAVRNTTYPNRPVAVQTPWKGQPVEVYRLR